MLRARTVSSASVPLLSTHRGHDSTADTVLTDLQILEFFKGMLQEQMPLIKAMNFSERASLDFLNNENPSGSIALDYVKLQSLIKNCFDIVCDLYLDSNSLSAEPVSLDQKKQVLRDFVADCKNFGITKENGEINRPVLLPRILDIHQNITDILFSSVTLVMAFLDFLVCAPKAYCQNADDLKTSFSNSLSKSSEWFHWPSSNLLPGAVVSAVSLGMYKAGDVQPTFDHEAARLGKGSIYNFLTHVVGVAEVLTVSLVIYFTISSRINGYSDPTSRDALLEFFGFGDDEGHVGQQGAFYQYSKNWPYYLSALTIPIAYGIESLLDTKRISEIDDSVRAGVFDNLRQNERLNKGHFFLELLIDSLSTIFRILPVLTKVSSSTLHLCWPNRQKNFSEIQQRHVVRDFLSNGDMGSSSSRVTLKSLVDCIAQPSTAYCQYKSVTALRGIAEGHTSREIELIFKYSESSPERALLRLLGYPIAVAALHKARYPNIDPRTESKQICVSKTVSTLLSFHAVQELHLLGYHSRAAYFLPIFTLLSYFLSGLSIHLLYLGEQVLEACRAAVVLRLNGKSYSINQFTADCFTVLLRVWRSNVHDTTPNALFDYGEDGKTHPDLSELRRIDLDGKFLNDSSFSTVISKVLFYKAGNGKKKGSSLEYLSVKDSDLRDIVDIIQSFPSALKGLDFRNNPNLTAGSVESIFVFSRRADFYNIFLWDTTSESIDQDMQTDMVINSKNLTEAYLLGQGLNNNHLDRLKDALDNDERAPMTLGYENIDFGNDGVAPYKFRELLLTKKLKGIAFKDVKLNETVISEIFEFNDEIPFEDLDIYNGGVDNGILNVLFGEHGKLKPFPDVKIVNLRNNNITDPTILFKYYLGTNLNTPDYTLEVLNLAGNPCELGSLMPHLKHFRGMKSLYLSSIESLSDPLVFSTFLDSLWDLENLEALCLDNLKIENKDQWPDLVKGLTNLKNLKTLSMKGTNFDDVAAQELSNVICDCQVLDNVYLQNTLIGPCGAGHLLQFAINNDHNSTGLKTLHLSDYNNSKGLISQIEEIQVYKTVIDSCRNKQCKLADNSSSKPRVQNYNTDSQLPDCHDLSQISMNRSFSSCSAPKQISMNGLRTVNASHRAFLSSLALPFIIGLVVVVVVMLIYYTYTYFRAKQKTPVVLKEVSLV